MTRLRAALALFAVVKLLAACSTGTPPVTPAPVPVTAPPVIAPEPPVFAAKFTTPDMAVGGLCDRWSPITCKDVPDGAVWMSNNFPGDGGALCVGPNPNPCYSVTDGVLITNPAAPGFPLITVQTFDRSKTIHVHMRTSVVCGSEGAWGGIVIDDGEPDYRAEYWICNKTGVEIHNFANVTEVPLSADRYAEGSIHDFDMSWSPQGTIAFAVDGVTKLTETPGSIGPDSTVLAHDPHVSLFSGGMALSVYGLAVYEEP
jgi:hypothetical protein